MDDLRRVDTWLKVIDILATSSERNDLLEKKEFLTHMRAWTLAVVRDATAGIETEDCAKAAREYLEWENAITQNNEYVGTGMPEWDGMHPDVFPLDQIYEGHLLKDSWLDDGMTWPYFAR